MIGSAIKTKMSANDVGFELALITVFQNLSFGEVGFRSKFDRRLGLDFWCTGHGVLHPFEKDQNIALLRQCFKFKFWHLIPKLAMSHDVKSR